MLDKIDAKIKEAMEALKRLGYICEYVSAKEFYDYMTGETFSEDIRTPSDVLENEFLMVHELMEVSELKKKGIPINKQTILRFPTRVYEVHLKAIEYELNFALLKKNYSWLRSRLKGVESCLQDEHLPKRLTSRCKSIIRRFARHLPKTFV